MRLHLLRHTKPQIAEGLCYGQTDVDVSQADCDALVQKLSSQLRPGLPVFSSPLQRCARLARLLHAEPLFDDRLKELNFGVWEMQAWDNIPRIEIDAWAAAPASYKPGGLESAIDLAQRTLSWLVDMHARNIPDAIVVTHAGVMRMLLAWQASMAAEELAGVVCAQSLSLAFGEYQEILVFNT
ncbi:histidine phosphatase family protein [Undibacterium umbellatum]|uniref:Histidine phosphatase family protein n=1 Tax=Undibacterium umbellatum TaxID=2762300 RepID=A0ABR6ZAM3_9BURK|nr:histidine phosphatase family protein [Undibacterium umbellatum]MBC3908684.1 histidine phosphatase family protein [Undibacterium umbellatum]